MSVWIGLIVFILLWLSLPSAAFPQIYKWTDRDGNIVFSDTPPAGADEKKVKVLKEREGPKPPEGIARRQGTSELPIPAVSQGREKREYRDIEVHLYMTEWCPYCLRARAYLKSLGVRLVEYDVDRDKSKNQERVRKGGKGSGVPLIDVEGIIVKGFSPDSIKSAVEKRRKI
jgi:glutaredoxin